MLAIFGPTDGAIELLKQALALAPGDGRALGALARAHVLRATGKKQQESDDDDKAERATSGSAEFELQRAEHYLERARKLVPDDAELLAITGHLHRTRAELLHESAPTEAEQQLKLSRSAYRKAIRRDESLPEAYVGLGLSYLIEDTGTVEPVVVLETAAYLLPLDTDVALALAKVHIQRGNHVQALPPLEYAMRWSHEEEARAAARALADKLRQQAALSSDQTDQAPAEVQSEPAP
jgi:hypothetical protein